ncbi:mediator of RNA polymerase II transcription subunit 33A-like protein, partial [Tanacetum coccineum]
SDLNKVDSGGMIGMLKVNALAHFTVLSGAIAWGVDSVSSASKKRPVILAGHSMWVCEVDVEILRSLSRGLRKWDEEELALALLRIGGASSMGAAAEFIVESLV